MPLARRNQLSAYDATYLELAAREQAPLATCDEALRVAAKREGVALFEDASP
jgi:predicted nucleic acid-binding protein